MSAQITIDSRVSCQFASLRPSSFARKLRTHLTADGLITDLQVAGFDERMFGDQEVVCALLRHDSDKNLELYTLETLLIPAVPLLTDPVPPPTLDSVPYPPAASVPTVSASTSSPQPSSSIPAPPPTGDANLARISAILSSVAKGKSNISVGDNVVFFRYSAMRPRSAAKAWAKSEFGKGYAKDVPIADIVMFQDRGDQIACIKVLLDNQTFHVPIRNITMKKRARKRSSAAASQQSEGSSASDAESSAAESGDAGESDHSSDEVDGELHPSEGFSPADTSQPVQWGEYAAITVDMAKDNLSTAKARFPAMSTREVRSPFTPLEMFEQCFPMSFVVDHVLPATNQAGSDMTPHDWMPVTLDELKRFIGLELLFTCHKHGSKDIFWSAKAAKLHETHLRVNHLMTHSRFRAISRALRLHLHRDKHDLFNDIRPLIAAWNAHMRAHYVPSCVSCLDESQRFPGLQTLRRQRGISSQRAVDCVSRSVSSGFDQRHLCN